MPELDPGNKKRLTWTVYATPLMTLTTDLGLSIRVSMFEYVRLVIGTSSCMPIRWSRMLREQFPKFDRRLRSDYITHTFPSSRIRITVQGGTNFFSDLEHSCPISNFSVFFRVLSQKRAGEGRQITEMQPESLFDFRGKHFRVRFRKNCEEKSETLYLPGQ